MVIINVRIHTEEIYAMNVKKDMLKRSDPKYVLIANVSIQVHT